MKTRIQTHTHDGWKIILKKLFGQQKEMTNFREKLRKIRTIHQGSPPAKKSYRKRKWKGENFQMNTKLKFLITKSLE